MATATADRKWFVFYTKSRQEKKVRDLLHRGGFEVFLPLQKVVRQWSDRKKKVEVPLFNSYIFVKEFEHNLTSILQVPGVAWTIRSNGRPAVLREDELDLIKRFLSTGLFLETATAGREIFKTGDKAMVTHGPLAGITGTVLRENDADKLNVVIEGIDQVIKVKLPSYLLKKA